MAVSMPEKLWVYRARPVRVIDGDTAVLEIDLGFGIAKSSADNHFRILGVNCPEKHGITLAAGLSAMVFTEQWLSYPHGDDWPLVIATQKNKSGEVRTFARWVAQIWRVSDGANLADDLVASGHAVRIRC